MWVNVQLDLSFLYWRILWVHFLLYHPCPEIEHKFVFVREFCIFGHHFARFSIHHLKFVETAHTVSACQNLISWYSLIFIYQISPRVNYACRDILALNFNCHLKIWRYLYRSYTTFTEVSLPGITITLLVFTWSSETSTHLIENGGSKCWKPRRGDLEQLVTNCNKKVKFHESCPNTSLNWIWITCDSIYCKK